MEKIANEIVWIYGSSAVGKATFIETIVQSHPQEIINDLEWNGKEIISCTESIKWVIRDGEEFDKQQRYQIPSIVERMLDGKTNTVALIKGQDLDLMHDDLLKLKSRLPNARHRIIFLHADPETLFRRVQSKIWWKGENATKDDLVKWVVYQIRHLLTLKNEFEIDIIKSGENKQYQLSESSLVDVHKSLGYDDLSGLNESDWYE